MPPNKAMYIPCHIEGPTLQGRFAPIYWAMNVFEYPAVPIKMLMSVKLNILAGIAAARASGECQDKNMRSMNCWIDQDPVLSIKGKAISRICW